MATILIVDDRASNREFLVTLLGYQNHKMVEAADGVEGLDRARTARPDLIITDILMPTMDGYEFTRRLRQDPELSSVPVVFYSANYLLQEARTLAAKCGVKHVLSKPCEPQEVLHTVDLALGLKPVAVAAPPVDEFDREHIRVLTDKLSQKADELQNLNARLEALVELGRELNVSEDPEQLVRTYCEGARQIIGSARSLIAIMAEGRQEPKHLWATGFGTEEIESVITNITLDRETVFSQAMRQRACRRGTNPGGDPAALNCAAGQPPIYSYLAVPVLRRNEATGWLGFANKIGGEAFSADDERLATMLAAQLAVAYENAQLYEKLKRYSQALERDVAERRRTAEKYRMVLEQASDGIAIADEQGTYVEVNPRLLEMLGYDRAQFLGLSMQDVIPREDLAQDPIPFDELRAGKLVRRERWFLRRDRSRLEVEISMSRLEDGRVQSIVRDVTERKDLERQLRQAQKLEAVGRLAGGVAHDFNNLLTVILGHCDLAMAGLDEDDRRRLDIMDVREAGTRASVLTTQLLAFSRKQILQPRVLNLNASISNLTKMLGRLISTNIEIRTRLDTELWLTKVDPVQLDQIVLNLAINSRDAMPLGGKLILETANQHFDVSAAGRPDIAPGDYVVLAISDTGCGMDAETRSHLFEPFFTTKAAGKGTGLGLSTVYGIVRQSGGHIWAYSEPGRGTTFKIYLPRAAAAQESLPRPEEEEVLPLGTETVLVVEDEQRVRSLAAIVLGQQGYRVLEASDGEEALRVAAEYGGEIHLLFSDLVMPKMTGNELASALRRTRPAIKVLLSSGYTDEAFAQEGGLDPSIPFLQKPFTPRRLAIKVRETLDGPPLPPGAPFAGDQPGDLGTCDPTIQ
jgi:PAS domain S-box-containing protein